jgi:malate dehydrogenase (oxaloacetate-decarboxylating)
MRHRRVRGADYQEFIDQFVAGVIRVYPRAVLQWEDFLKENALTQLQRFRDRLCTFNDDIQGTAAIVVAGIYGALRITRRPLREQRVVIAGAGASAQGIADLVVAAFRDAGLTPDEARRRIATVDSRGLVTTARPNLEAFKASYALAPEDVASYDAADRSRITLVEAIRGFKPTVLLGVSGTGGLFTEPVIRAMAVLNERPIVFPLSNPTTKSECTAEQAIHWSDGRAIVATGSPFPPVEYGGIRRRIGQCNNSFVFPGVGLGLWVGRVTRVTDAMFLDAAKALAREVTDDDLAHGAIYPELRHIRDCSRAVACAVIRRAVAGRHGDERLLDDLDGTVRRAMWLPHYAPIGFEREATAEIAETAEIA